MQEIAEQMQEAAAIVRKRWTGAPRVGLILGTGLGRIAREIDAPSAIDFGDLPHFPLATAIGHRGRLVCGTLAGKPVLAFQGRLHLYEGYTPQQASLPVRLLQTLGAGTLVVCNAAGGLNPQYRVGDLVLLDDQINLQFVNPLVGMNDDSLGPRFPDMSAPFDAELQQIAQCVAKNVAISLHCGVYASVPGPNYETRAEYRMLRRLGADAVGMSTTPETIAARHAGMRVVGFSTITNVGSPDIHHATDGHDVESAAVAASDKLRQIVRGLIESI